MDAAELCKTRKASWCKRVAQCACGAIHSFSTGSVENQKLELFQRIRKCGVPSSWFHFRAILEPKDEFESRPNLIHGADFDVHQTGGQTDVPDNVLGKIS